MSLHIAGIVLMYIWAHVCLYISLYLEAYLYFYILCISWKECGGGGGGKEGACLLITLTWLCYSFVFNNTTLFFYCLHQHGIAIPKKKKKSLSRKTKVVYNFIVFLGNLLKKKPQVNDHQTVQLFNKHHQMTVNSLRHLKPWPQKSLLGPHILNYFSMTPSPN